MTEDEIRELALELGLNPDKLKLCEPWTERIGLFKGCKRFRFEYFCETAILDYNFIVSDPDDERYAVEFYVNKGLRELRDKLVGQ